MTPLERAANELRNGKVPRHRRFPHVPWDADYEAACDALEQGPMKMLKHAALAIMRTEYPDDVDPEGNLTEAGQTYWDRKGHAYLSAAEAVLVAIRNPSEGMLEAGARAHKEQDRKEDDTARPSWQAMIDAALSEGEAG